MKRKSTSAIIFGALLVLSIQFENLLWETLWIFQPILLTIIGIGSLIILLNALIRKHWKSVTVIAISILLAVSIYLSRTEFFKSPPVLKARLIDDLSGISLTLREDNTFELIPESWLGASDEFKGAYQIDGNKIIFLDKPYYNSFIPDTVNIYRDKIILNGDLAKLDTSFANYFSIYFNEIPKNQ
tara:strand:+ start:2136 stop:2690 length:555 start_codon:yes stop_codon:yes gene_type:complete